jgi:hypothetical protein
MGDQAMGALAQDQAWETAVQRYLGQVGQQVSGFKGELSGQLGQLGQTSPEAMRQIGEEGSTEMKELSARNVEEAEAFRDEQLTALDQDLSKQRTAGEEMVESAKLAKAEYRDNHLAIAAGMAHSIWDNADNSIKQIQSNPDLTEAQKAQMEFKIRGDTFANAQKQMAPVVQQGNERLAELNLAISSSFGAQAGIEGQIAKTRLAGAQALNAPVEQARSQQVAAAQAAAGLRATQENMASQLEFMITQARSVMADDIVELAKLGTSRPSAIDAMSLQLSMARQGAFNEPARYGAGTAQPTGGGIHGGGTSYGGGLGYSSQQQGPGYSPFGGSRRAGIAGAGRVF